MLTHIPDSKYYVDCKRHSLKDYPTITNYGKLHLGDPLSVFDCIKSTSIPTVPSAPEKLSEHYRNSR